MSPRNLAVIDSAVQKTNEILKAVEERFAWKDRHKAYVALRSVLHALRDRLTVESAVSLSAQLPLLVKGFYFDGWKPANKPIKMKKDEFVMEVEMALNVPFEHDVEDIIRGVVEIIESYTDPAEMHKVKKLLPKEIMMMLNESDR